MTDMSNVATGSVDAASSAHNLEHLYPHEVPVALAEFYRVLANEGLVVLTCPDLKSVAALIVEDKLEDPAYIAPAGPISPIDILYGFRAAMQKAALPPCLTHKKTTWRLPPTPTPRLPSQV